MRKEIYGIILFFLVIFTLISLLSYSPADPSINNSRAAGQIHNLFGFLGAHVSGFLIGLFGLGAFWIPILLLLASIHFFGNHPSRVMVATLIGGIILVVITGSLLEISAEEDQNGRELRRKLSGADRVLNKPVQPAELLAGLNRLLNTPIKRKFTLRTARQSLDFVARED